jgi:hypothetical protein
MKVHLVRRTEKLKQMIRKIQLPPRNPHGLVGMKTIWKRNRQKTQSGNQHGGLPSGKNKRRMKTALKTKKALVTRTKKVKQSQVSLLIPRNPHGLMKTTLERGSRGNLFMENGNVLGEQPNGKDELRKTTALIEMRLQAKMMEKVK